MSTPRPLPIRLSGVYNDCDACNYVVLQDDLRALDRDVSMAYVRVMRQGHWSVHTGTILVARDVFKALGMTDSHRNGAIARALILWLQYRSMRQRFAVRVSVAPDEADGAGIRFEEAGVQCS